jgi:hypothetical protein
MKSKYKIKKRFGMYVIKRKSVDTRIVGFLWWRKCKKTVTWRDIDINGVPLFYMRFLNNYGIAHKGFSTKQDAKIYLKTLLN